MKDTLKQGLETSRRFTVDEARAIDFLVGEGEGGDAVGNVRVYATPALVKDIEFTCRDFLLEHLDEGEDSLGVGVDLQHLAPTLLGMWVEVAARVKTVDGRAVSFEVTVSDPVEEVARGRHDRFVIDVGKIRGRLADKAEKAARAAES